MSLPLNSIALSSWPKTNSNRSVLRLNALAYWTFESFCIQFEDFIWDESLSAELTKEWESIAGEFKEFSKLKIPR